MKLAIICAAGTISGKEIMSLELGQGLRQAGHEIFYVTSSWGDTTFRTRALELGLRMTSMRLGFISASLSLRCIKMTLDQLLRAPELWRDYSQFLRNEGPVQIIHTNWHHLLMLRPFLNPGRDWFWLHEVIPNRAQYRILFRHLSRCLRGIVPVSCAVKQSLIRIGVPEDKIHVIHNGLIDPAVAFQPTARKSGTARIGIVGQVAPWKGHEDLFEAFSKVAPKYPAAELHVYGSGRPEFIRSLNQRAQTAGFSNRLYWHGFVGNRAEIYSGLDLCAVPTRTADPLPTSAIEAAFFGMPVIASKIGGLPEIVEQTKTGYLFEPGNVTELAQYLEELMEDHDTRYSMGIAARDHALRLFSQQRFINDFQALLVNQISNDSCLLNSLPRISNEEPITP